MTMIRLIIRQSGAPAPLMLLAAALLIAGAAHSPAVADNYICRPIENACKNYMIACAASGDGKCYRCGYPPIFWPGASCVGTQGPCTPFTDPEPACGIEEVALCEPDPGGFDHCVGWMPGLNLCGRRFCHS